MNKPARRPVRGLYYIRDRHTHAWRESALAQGRPVCFSRADMALEYLTRAGDPNLRVVLVQPIGGEYAE
jgi:hypothetical protein